MQTALIEKSVLSRLVNALRSKTPVIQVELAVFVFVKIFLWFLLAVFVSFFLMFFSKILAAHIICRMVAYAKPEAK